MHVSVFFKVKVQNLDIFFWLLKFPIFFFFFFGGGGGA